jgi:TonB-dependent starch-binding outer membrane protein SusC
VIEALPCKLIELQKNCVVTISFLTQNNKVMFFITNCHAVCRSGLSRKGTPGKRAKFFRIMKLITVFMLAAVMQVAAKGTAQTVTYSAKNAKLQTLLQAVEKQTGFVFFYNNEDVDKATPVTVTLSNIPITKALDEIFKNQSLGYDIQGKTIFIKYRPLPVIAITGETPVPTKESVPLAEIIKGRVVNENGEPVVGASVIIKGTNTGTNTNSNGEFEITAPTNNVTLVISSVNIEPYEIKTNGRTNLATISVKTKIIETAAVVVNTGFQTISKERSTAASDRVTDAILSKRPVTNLANALAGQVAGLVADPNTGFVIRGRSSLSNNTADRTPLLVVDGFPIEGGFNSINPNDVKTIDVLKDAAATSIYGARAANGVIVITTKGMGAKGRMNVTYNSFVSIGSQIDLDNYMNIADAATQIAYEDKLFNTFKGLTTNIYADPYTRTNGSFRGNLSPYASLLVELSKGNITQQNFDSKKQEILGTSYKDDYQKYLLRNSVVQQHNIVISGAGDRNSYKFSALYDDDKTSFQFNDNNKVLLGFTNIFNITNNIKYTFNTNLTQYNTKTNGISLAHAKSVTSPWTKLVDNNGNYTRMDYQNYEPLVQTFEPRLPYSMRYNLLEEASLRDNNYKGQDLRIQNELEIKFLKHFKIRPMLQYELFTDESTSVYDEKSYASRNYANWVSTLNTTTNTFVSQIPKGGIYRKNGANRRRSLKFRTQLDYNKTFGSRHEVVAVAGGEVINTRTEVSGPDLKFGYSGTSLNYALFDYAVDRFDMFNLGTILENSVSYEGANIYDFKASSFRQNRRFNERYLAGYFNAAYTFDQKYTASISARTDASNYVSQTVRDKFSPFYSAGLRWNIAKENFLKNAKFIDQLALRTTYGVTGNAAGKTSVLALSVFSTSAPSTETGNLPAGFITGRDNDFLTWEKTYSTNVGADFSFFKGKISGSIDLYRRHSKDLLSSVLTSQVIQSTSSLTLNLAEVLNKGIEVSLGTKQNFGKNFSWNGNLNFDYNYNEVLSYNFLAPALFNYLGTNTTFIQGLPTDRLMMVRLAGTNKDGYFVQQKRNGELIVANTTTNSFAEVGGFGMGRMTSGLSPKDDDRLYYQGRTTPPATLGFTNTFNYKGISLMAVITGRFGHKFLRTDENLLYSLGANSYSASGLAALQASSLIATTATGNINATIINQAVTGTSSSLRNFYSEAVVEDASSIRLNELYLGYDFAGNTLGKLGNIFKSATLYTQARNMGLLWKANDRGIDPDFPLGTLKPVKTFTFGVRLGL